MVLEVKNEVFLSTRTSVSRLHGGSSNPVHWRIFVEEKRLEQHQFNIGDPHCQAVFCHFLAMFPDFRTYFCFSLGFLAV